MPPSSHAALRNREIRVGSGNPGWTSEGPGRIGQSACLTCRAVLAAKIDFDLTDERSNNDPGEAKRRAEHFFRTEASVGMR